jgi:hypothetical protein
MKTVLKATMALAAFAAAVVAYVLLVVPVAGV